VLSSIDELIGKTNKWTTGYGSMLKDWPGSAAMNYKVELKTLASNIAFNELAQMRASSKTGGSLGQISDRESELLSNSLAAIEQAQKDTDVVSNLQQARAAIERWQRAQGATGGAGGGAGAGPGAGAGAPNTDPLGLGNLPRRPKG
jgi:hypothetical protein